METFYKRKGLAKAQEKIKKNSTYANELRAHYIHMYIVCILCTLYSYIHTICLWPSVIIRRFLWHIRRLNLSPQERIIHPCDCIARGRVNSHSIRFACFPRMDGEGRFMVLSSTHLRRKHCKYNYTHTHSSRGCGHMCDMCKKQNVGMVIVKTKSNV